MCFAKVNLKTKFHHFMKTMSVHYAIHPDSFIGHIGVAASALGILKISIDLTDEQTFLESLKTTIPGIEPRKNGKHVQSAMEQIKEFLHGQRQKFNLSLYFPGQYSQFQIKVLQTVALIPFGRAMSYGDVARNAGNPNAYRAVGGVMGRNPFPLVVP